MAYTKRKGYRKGRKSFSKKGRRKSSKKRLSSTYKMSRGGGRM